MTPIIYRSLCLLIPATISLFFACSQPMELYGQCSRGGCPNDGLNAQPDGSICNTAGMCQCPVGTYECCPEGPPGVCQKEPCSHANKCPNDGDPDGGPPVAECDEDLDCAQPKSSQCGKGLCVDGKCKLEIHAGPAPSQLYGDCLRRDCNAQGELVEVEDTTDYYDDGKGCTVDFCKDKKAQNLILADGTPCPDKNEGYCYQQACVECIDWMSFAKCGEPNLFCDVTYCVPIAQCPVNACGGPCAPCSAGSACTVNADCLSNVCKGSMCVLGTCSDGTQNNTETGVDCGGDCPPCAAGQTCASPIDCASNVCKEGFCMAPTCTDGKQNGSEAGVDCGLEACNIACP